MTLDTELLAALGDDAYASISTKLQPLGEDDYQYVKTATTRYVAQPTFKGTPPQSSTLAKFVEPLVHLALYVESIGKTLRTADSEDHEDYRTKRRHDTAITAPADCLFLAKLGPGTYSTHMGRIRQAIELVEGPDAAEARYPTREGGRRRPVDLLKLPFASHLAQAMGNLATNRDRYLWCLPTFVGLDMATALEVQPHHITYTEEGVPTFHIPASTKCPINRKLYAYGGHDWIAEYHRDVLKKPGQTYMLCKPSDSKSMMTSDDAGRIIRDARTGLDEQAAEMVTWGTLRVLYLCFLVSTRVIGDGSIRCIMGIKHADEGYRIREGVDTAIAAKAKLSRWGFGAPGSFGHANLYCKTCKTLSYDPSHPTCRGCSKDLERLPTDQATLAHLVHQLTGILERLGLSRDTIQAAAANVPWPPEAAEA